MELPNIQYRGDIVRSIETVSEDYDGITYFKSIEDLMDQQAFSNFITNVEKLVRTSDDYKKFIAYIKSTLGINFCQVFSNIRDTDKESLVELHHGPIFTLYDICETVLTKFIKTGIKINTFRVASEVLDLHFAMKVNCVMLAKTTHEMAHNQDVFINIDQQIGDIDTFIKEYTPYLSDESKYKIWTYMEMSKNNRSFDRGILDLDYVKKYIAIT